MTQRPFPARELSLSSVDDASARPVIRLLDLVLSEAIRAGAHTLEFRPADDSGLVLWDQDGALTQRMRLPADAHSRLMGRLKALLGHAPGSPGPFEGALSIAAEGLAANLDVRIATESGGSAGATIRILQATGPHHADAAT